MVRILRRPEFKRDLYEIWSRIALDSEQRADAFLAALQSKFLKLSESPLIGVAKLLSFPRARVFPYKDYLVIYEPLEGGDGVDLIRSLHGAREWRRLLGEDES